MNTEVKAQIPHETQLQNRETLAKYQTIMEPITLPVLLVPPNRETTTISIRNLKLVIIHLVLKLRKIQTVV